MATTSISQDLADLLATKNFDPKYTDEKGMDASPGEAVVFSFDWKAQSGKNYGTAVAVIGDENDLQFFFGDNLGRSIEDPRDKEEWFAFLETLSNFATQHRYTWSPKDINQLKHTMAGIAAIKEGLFEGYYGTRRVSYMGEQTQARLVIKHNRMLGENDKRYRYVESLYIETADSERFKLPFTKLAGGRAMLEHVRQGGKPYDIRGAHICEMVTEMNLLARFNRANQSRVFEGNTQALVESAQAYYQTLQESLKHLASNRGYTNYFESWSPADIGSEDALVEDIKTLFVEQTLDARIESALPLLAKIQQGTAMKEVNVFETWINRMVEGTWALPDTPEQEAKLQELMAQELPAGPDGTNATEQLYDLVGDDHLFDLIQAAAAADPNANIWDNAEIVGRLGELGVDVSAITQHGAEQEPEQEMDEGFLGDIGDEIKHGIKGVKRQMAGKPSRQDVKDKYRDQSVAARQAGDKEAADKNAAKWRRVHNTTFGGGMSESGVAEMDKSQPSHGRDGKISHSTYGSRDRGGSTGPERTGKMTTAQRMMKDAEKSFLKHMSSAEKVDKGHRNPNVDEAGKKIPASNKPVDPKDLVVSLKDVPVKKPRGHTQYDPAVEFPGVKAFKKPNVAENPDLLDEVSDSTLMSYLTKVAADSQKHEKDPTKRSPAKANRSVAGFSRAFNKLDARKGVDEEDFGPATTAALQQGKSPTEVHYADTSDKLNAAFHNIAMKEGRMADTDAIIQSIIAGDTDPYDIMAHATTPEEQYVAKILQKEYEDVAIDHRLHPDDDFEQILDRVVDRLAHDYGHTMDEADTMNSFNECGTVAGGMAPVQGELEEAQWGQAPQDPMNANSAITGSYYENEDPLVRLKTLALSK